MPTIRMSEPGVYVPDRGENDANVITNRDLEQLVETSNDWIIERTGMSEGRIEHHLATHEMGYRAVLDLQKRTGFNPEEIDEIRFATNKHHLGKEFRNAAGYVAGEMGIKNAALQDHAAGCSGLVYTFYDARNSLLCSKKRKIVVVGAERLTDITNYGDRNTCVLFGDAACAYLLEKIDGEEEGIINIVTGGQPDMGNLEWPGGFLTLTDPIEGLKIRVSPAFLEDPTKPKFETYPAVQPYMVMFGKEIFKYATREMTHSVHEVLEGTPYGLPDIDVIIPHGANARITDNSRNRLEDKGFKGIVYTNMDRFRNTSTASVGIAEEEARRKGIIKPGMLVVQVAFGAGLTRAASLERAS